MSEEKMSPWKSLFYALCGALTIYCSIEMSELPKHENFSVVVMAIWGTSFWVGGFGNLLVDWRLQREKKKCSPTS